MEHPGELRELASWYRNWAELGNKMDRGWREGFADYLEQRATEMERLLTLAEKRADLRLAEPNAPRRTVQHRSGADA